MNLPEKLKHWVCSAVLLMLMGIGPLMAQNWQEYQVLNHGNHLSFQRSVFFNPNVIQYPDPAVGTLQLTMEGSTLTITFTPVEDAVGIAEFIIEYFPNQLPPMPKIEAFRVYVADSYVIARRDYVTVPMNASEYVIEPLLNDSAVGAPPLVISYIPAVQNGTVAIAQDGQSVLFTPDTDFTGMAYLMYVVCDAFDNCDKASVNICVVDENGISAVDTIHLATNSKTPVEVFLPDTGFELSQTPLNGSAYLLSGDAWAYKPFASYSGTDQFILSNGTLTRVVLVDVYYKPPANTFVNHDIFYTRINETLTFNVHLNDIKKYPIASFTSPNLGALQHDTLGVFTYTPPQGYHGAQHFSYTACFLSQCETGDVVIYVGDMIPQNTETYHLVTSIDVPLVLNYEIPLEGYSFVISAPPSDGDLVLHSGQQIIQVACEDVSGYDLLVFTPSAGSQGSDYFEISYCIDGGNCHLVKVNVSIEDAGISAMPCPCVDRCVWPGDADGNGQVTMDDLLTIGWLIGSTGEDRNYPDNTQWLGQSSEDWQSGSWHGMNAKYADSDGDGVITESDIQSVLDHYLYRHTLVPQISGLKAEYAFELVPHFTELDSGDLAVFDVVIGTAANPVIDMHGMSFSLNLPEQLVDPSTVQVDFHSQSWLGHAAPTVAMQILPHDGRIDAGFTRTTGVPANGSGIIATLSFIVVDDIEGVKLPDGRQPLHVGVNTASSISGAGMMYDIPGDDVTIFISGRDRKTNRSALEESIIVFPNPSTGSALQVHVNGDRILQKLDVYCLSGVHERSITGLDKKQHALDITDLHEGLYLLRVTTDDGAVTRKFHVLRPQ